MGRVAPGCMPPGWCAFVAVAAAAPAPTQLTIAGPAKAVGGRKEGQGHRHAHCRPANRWPGRRSPSCRGSHGSRHGHDRLARAARTGTSSWRRPSASSRATRPPAPTRPPTRLPSAPAVTLAPVAGVSVGIDSYLRAGRKAVGIADSPVRVRGSVRPTRRAQRRAVGLPRTAAGAARDPPGDRVAQRPRKVRTLDRALPPRRIPGDRAAARRRGGGDSTRLYVVRASAHWRLARHRRARPPAPARRPRLRDAGQRPLRREHRPRRARVSQGQRLCAHHLRRPRGVPQAGARRGRLQAALSEGRQARRVRLVPPGAGARARVAPADHPAHVVRRASTPTVFGKFRFYRKSARLQRQGHVLLVLLRRRLRDPRVQPVPTFPASHGCLRIPIPSAKRVYGWVSLGDTIYTYR